MFVSIVKLSQSKTKILSSFFLTGYLLSGCSAFDSWQPTATQVQPTIPMVATVTVEESDALVSLLKRVQTGDAHAQAELADQYLIGDIVPVNPKEAYHYYILAAQNGLTYAQLMAAWLSTREFSNLDASLHWSRIAQHAKDYSAAAYQFAQLFLDHKMLYAKPDIAYQWFLRSARAGCVAAMNATADLYLLGKGTEVSPSKALYWWQQAAKMGNAYAQYSLGNLLLSKQAGISGGQRAGFNALLSAAKQGMVAAQIAVGRAYHEGKIVPQNNSEAYAWLMVSNTSEINPTVAALINTITLSLSEAQLVQAVAERQEYSARYLNINPPVVGSCQSFG